MIRSLRGAARVLLSGLLVAWLGACSGVPLGGSAPGPGASFAGTNPPGPPVAVTVHVGSGAARATIPVAGGELSTQANGLTYTLTIPKGALLSDLAVTMTPVTSLDGLPFSGGLLGGVQLEPDGAALLTPATLTIKPAAGFDVTKLVGFAYHGDGQNLHLALADGDGASVSLRIMSFSGHGAASGSSSDLSGHAAGSAQDGFEQAIADILAHARANGQEPSDYTDQLEALLKDYYDTTLKPALQAATTDDSSVDTAVSQYLSWARDVELLGLDDALSSRRQEGDRLMTSALKNAFDKASQRCLSNQDVDEAGNMLKRLRQLALLGGDDGGYTLEGKRAEFDRCLRFKLRFDSDLGWDIGPGMETVTAHVAGDVTLTLDDSAAFFDVYRGSGTVSYKKFAVELTALKGLCQVTSQSSSGRLRVLAKLSWYNLNAAKPSKNTIVAVKPSGLDSKAPKWTCAQGAGTITARLGISLPMWMAGFDKLHADIKGSLEDLDDAYIFTGLESVGGKVVARLAKSYSKTVSSGDANAVVDEALSLDVTASPGA